MKYLIPGSDGKDKGYGMEVIYKNSDQDYDSRYERTWQVGKDKTWNIFISYSVNKGFILTILERQTKIVDWWI